MAKRLSDAEQELNDWAGGGPVRAVTEEENRAAEERLAAGMAPPVAAEPEPRAAEEDEDQGEGLDAATAAEPDTSAFTLGNAVHGELLRIPLDELRPSPGNPRKHFDANFIAGLAANIRAHGLIEPAVVRPLQSVAVLSDGGRWSGARFGPASCDQVRHYLGGLGDCPYELNSDCGYEIVAGEQRWRAHLHLRMLAEGEGNLVLRQTFEAMDCIVRDLTDAQVREMQLSENLQRADLSPAELAQSYRELVEIERGRGTVGAVQTVAERLGVSKSVVDQALQLLKAIPECLRALELGFITKNHAADCSRLPEAAQLRYLNICILGYDNGRELTALLEGGQIDKDVNSVRAMRGWIEATYPPVPEAQQSFFGGGTDAHGETKAAPDETKGPIGETKPPAREILEDSTVADAAMLRAPAAGDDWVEDEILEGQNEPAALIATAAPAAGFAPNAASTKEVVREASEKFAEKQRREVVERERMMLAMLRQYRSGRSGNDQCDLLVEGVLIEQVGREEAAFLCRELGWRALPEGERADYTQHLLSEYRRTWARDRTAFVVMAATLSASYNGEQVAASILKGYGLDYAKVIAGELPPEKPAKNTAPTKPKRVPANLTKNRGGSVAATPIKPKTAAKPKPESKKKAGKDGKKKAAKKGGRA